MDELFGAPVSTIAVVLGVIFAVIAAFLMFIAAKNPILVKMAARNVVRRPARTVLIIVGLMLATAIISIAFTTGDSVTYSIKKVATESLRSMDEVVRVDEDSQVWDGKAVPDEFSDAVFARVAPALESDPDVDGVLPVLVEQVAVINPRSQLFETSALFTGVEPARASRFEPLKDSQGNAVDMASLGPGEVYIDSKGADELSAVAGDVLEVALGPGRLRPFTVRAVVDGWFFKQEDTKVVIMLPLSAAQEALGLQGQLSSILISNRGGWLEGVELTPAVVERFGELPAITEAGLEVFDVKRTVVQAANEAGSLFVSFFTTFGLFSIGVGLLMIFLIFSMLSAERKGEMGMSRAVGMQRRHLVRMFMAEGAIYGLGSAVVGALIGVGLGFLLVIAASSIFSNVPEAEEFTLSTHVEARSVLVSFLVGSIITLVTVGFASRQTSRLNIVRAIRDIPEPRRARAGRATLVWGLIIAAAGLIVLVSGLNSAQLTVFGLGVSFIPIGIVLILRWRGVAQRWLLTLLGLLLVSYWLLPPSVYNKIKEDWNQDFSIFFVSSALVVTGAILVTVNNSPIVLGLLVGTIGRFRHLTPIVKSAVVYPLRFGFRTGLSMAMFAVVIMSVTVMAVLVEGFTKLFDDQARLGGGYEVIGFATNDLNPVADLSGTVEADPAFSFVSRRNGKPSVGTFRTIFQADGRLAESTGAEFKDTSITGVDDDFVASNKFGITLATAEYVTDGGYDSARLWRDLKERPGLAVASSRMLLSRNNFGFGDFGDSLRLDVEGLFIENEVMEPVKVTVRDLKSGTTFSLTVIGVIDEFVSQGPFPFGLYTSTNTFEAQIPREVSATLLFFNVEPGVSDAAKKIEAGLFQHGITAVDVAEMLEGAQAAQRGFFNLLMAFMLLGLVVGIAALGVISARAVVERRHQIGVMRSIGFSRSMVRFSFLAESSFIGLVGIVLGLGLGLLTSVNVMADIRTDEPGAQLIIPWVRLLLIGLGAYVFSLLTTYMPAHQASRIAPAAALRYE